MPPAPPKNGGGNDPAFPNKTTRGKWLATIGVPACLLGMVVGAFAIMVLSEPNSALAATQFGVIVQKITGWNKLVLALVFNGSLIGLASSCVYLFELRLENIAAKRELAATKESKKE